MVIEKITPKLVYLYLQWVGKSLGVWPINTEDRILLILYELYFWFCFVSNVLLMMPTIYGLYMSKGNIELASYLWIELCGLLEVIILMIHSKLQKTRLKNLLELVNEQVTKQRSRSVRNYFDFYVRLYISLIGLYATSLLMFFFIDKPKTDNQQIITTALYPFEIETTGLKAAVYLNQLFSLVYAQIIPYSDGIIVLLIIVCIERLKEVENLFRNARSMDQLKKCIRMHNEVLWVIDETNQVVRFIIFKTVCFFTSCIFGTGLQIMNNSALSQTIHQIFIISVVYVRIYLCAESAHDMTSTGEDITYAIYSTRWYNQKPYVVAAKSMIIKRCQSLPKICIGGVMTMLGRTYLVSIFYMSYSYLMTLISITGSKY